MENINKLKIVYFWRKKNSHKSEWGMLTSNYKMANTINLR